MPSARRFPPPWAIDEHNDACFIARDANGQALGYFYFEEEPQRSAHHCEFASIANFRQMQREFEPAD